MTAILMLVMMLFGSTDLSISIVPDGRGLPDNKTLKQIKTNYHQWQEDKKVVEQTGVFEIKDRIAFFRRVAKLDNITLDAWARGTYLVLAIEDDIYSLWRRTGHCLFADIPCDKVIEKAPEIVERYRKFLKENSKISQEKLFLSGLKSNINLIKTSYCWTAVKTIEEEVWFKNPVFVTGVYRCVDIPLESRLEAHKAMIKWYKQNETTLEWNSWKYKFGIKPYVLPDAVKKSYFNRNCFQEHALHAAC